MLSMQPVTPSKRDVKPMTTDEAPAVTWWLEFENGGRSMAYATEAEAWAALSDLQSPKAQTSPLYSRPVWLVSSDGFRFAFHAKTAQTNTMR
jgi:hypothetical protein